MTVTSSTSSSKPEGARLSARTLPVTMTRGFLGEGLEGVEDVLGDGGFGDDALDGAGAVAEDGEEELAGLAQVVEPAAEGDGLADVLLEVGDGGEVQVWLRT